MVLLRLGELVVVELIRRMVLEAVRGHYWPDSSFHLRVVLMVRAAFVPAEPLSVGTDSYPIAWFHRLVVYPGRHHEIIEVHAVVSDFLVSVLLVWLAALVVLEFLLEVDSNV